MTERDPEFIAAFDGLVERCLCRICGPARDHFIDPETKIQGLLRLTNTPNEKLIQVSIRRLVRSGRVSRATRQFAGRTVTGIVCLPRREWEARVRVPSLSTFSLTISDISFLRATGVVVDPQDVRDCVLAD